MALGSRSYVSDRNEVSHGLLWNWRAHVRRGTLPLTHYVDLQVTSNCSFRRGASHRLELFLQAKALGLSSIAITDHNTLAGIAFGA